MEVFTDGEREPEIFLLRVKFIQRGGLVPNLVDLVYKLREQQRQQVIEYKGWLKKERTQNSKMIYAQQKIDSLLYFLQIAVQHYREAF